MGFRTIVAKHKGVCRRCDGPIAPGSKIRWAPRGGSFHLAADCPASPDRFAAINPVTGERMSDGARVSVATFSSGESVTVNRNGRCIDAPCCGCCTA